MELKKLLQPVYLNYKDEVGNEVVIQNRMHLLNSNEMEEILDGNPGNSYSLAAKPGLKS